MANIGSVGSLLNMSRRGIEWCPLLSLRTSWVIEIEGICEKTAHGQKKEPGVKINECQKHLFQHTRLASVHLIKDPLRFLSPFKKFLYKQFGKTDKSAIYDYFDK